MFKRFLILALLIVSLTGCHGVKAKEGLEEGYSPIGYPNVTEYGNIGYFYIVDNNTGVVYLCYGDGYRCGITVMLDENGDPITVDDLKGYK